MARVLARRQLLLVLDNCEHVIGAAAGVALQVAEQAAAGLQTSTAEEVAAARWLDAEEAAMRQVLAWAMDHDPATAARLAGALGWWWWLRGGCRASMGCCARSPGAPMWAATAGAGSSFGSDAPRTFLRRRRRGAGV